jgi:hypothetical protein
VAQASAFCLKIESTLRALAHEAEDQPGRAAGYDYHCDHDLNSFRLRLDPVDGKDDALQPGMTVWLTGGE